MSKTRVVMQPSKTGNAFMLARASCGCCAALVIGKGDKKILAATKLPLADLAILIADAQRVQADLLADAKGQSH